MLLQTENVKDQTMPTAKTSTQDVLILMYNNNIMYNINGTAV